MFQSGKYVPNDPGVAIQVPNTVVFMEEISFANIKVETHGNITAVQVK